MPPPHPGGELSLHSAARILAVRRTEHTAQLRPLDWCLRWLHACTHRHAGSVIHASGHKRGSAGASCEEKGCPKTQALNVREECYQVSSVRCLRSKCSIAACRKGFAGHCRRSPVLALGWVGGIGDNVQPLRLMHHHQAALDAESLLTKPRLLLRAPVHGH